MELPETEGPDWTGPLETARTEGRPLVLRGRVQHWPVVQAAARGDADLAAYLSSLDAGATSKRMKAPASEGGHFFYGPELRGHNFTREPTTVSAMIRDLLAAPEVGPALYLGAAPMPASLPRFSALNPPPGTPEAATPRLWLGNAVEVQTHFDVSENLACVVAGRRRFTLFAPEMTEGLYPGPLEHTLAGQPVSMVRLNDPDPDAYPAFEQVRPLALTAELEPGDAIYIPPLWWHHVQASARLNVLVNYWWDAVPLAGSGFEALVHALYAIRALPPATRQAWRAMFDHFVFGTRAVPPGHLPESAQGILGPLTPETAGRLKAYLLGSLSRN